MYLRHLFHRILRLLLPEIDQLDLTNQQAVANFFASEQPEYVLLAAAKVLVLTIIGSLTRFQCVATKFIINPALHADY